jgi:hypothetical protein
MNQKHLFSSFVLVFVFVLAFLGHQQTASASEVKLTKQLNTNSNNNDLEWDHWHRSGKDVPFTTTNGDIVTEGFGLEAYYSDTYRTFASFYIGDYSYTTLDTTISLESDYTLGDLGETEVAIYADSQKIYTKHFTNKTKAQHIQVGIPANTKELDFYILQKKGTKGAHSIIFADPKLTNTLPKTPKSNVAALFDLSPSEVSYSSDIQTKLWSNDLTFENTKGTYIARAVAISPYYSDTKRSYAVYNISDFNYTTLETNISLDNAYRIGDLGETQVEIYADNQRIYTKKFTNKTGIQKLNVSIPKGTVNLKFFVLQHPGAQGHHRVILENPLLTNKNSSVKKTKTVSLRDIGIAESTSSSVYFGSWNGKNTFQLKNGQMVGRAYGFEPYYKDTNLVSAKFYVGDYSYKKFKTTFSVDKYFSTGSRGSATVQVYAGSKKIYAKKYTNSTKVQNVSIKLPKKTKYLTVKVIYKRGSNYATLPIIMDNPLLAN